jgi:glyoxylase-like metal-dependent hydrolase (beta-lactamase superfamily II)
MGAQKHIVEGIEVWCLQDGAKSFDAAVFPDVSDAVRAERLAAAGLTEIETAFNAYLLRHPDGAVDLVDAGCGTRFGPIAGFLPSRLKALGVLPGDIRHLIFTHLHGDHCGGAVHEGQALFSKAQVFVHPADIAQYGGDGPAAEMLSAYAGRITEIMADDELPGGLRVWGLPGHAPGHVGLRIGDSFALVGDILHSFALQLPDPDLCPVYDHDKDLARQSRQTALDELARTGAIWSGSHGIGHRFLRVESAGQGFRVSPA